jgi:aryl-alcohol dehydrogenase-like predicted oxidoreductase
LKGAFEYGNRMQTSTLGRNGPAISALGLGCMGFSGGYGAVDDADSIATIRAALDAGVIYLDTGDFYGSGQNEMLLGRALKGRREKAFIAVKFGALRGPDGVWHGSDNRPGAVKSFLAYTLRRLGTDYVDLYQPARVDPAVPIEDTVGAIAEMVRAGYVRHIGLSEAGAATIRRARAVHPIVALQIEYSLMSRGVENEILPALRELGISLVAYGVLSRGLISDHALTGAPTGEIRGRIPRFQGENLARNRALVEALQGIAKEKGCTTAQLAIAWVASRGDDVIPLIGAKRPDQVTSAIGALDVALSPADLARIEAAVPAAAVASERYGAALMTHLDSEHAS